ncbi:mucin-1-like [Moschus berezovskii]|uniref:mucin-1-like n=1 Tax=Moschus berezovskii TaxID=68408 RepID=UPI002443BF27|nr:mucin-1-like [Moschus berezovskii]
MVGRLGPDLGARGPTRGGTRPCGGGGGGGAQPSGMARGLSSRPEGAAAPDRRARNLGRSEQTGSARRAGGRYPLTTAPPRRASPAGPRPRPGPGSAARARTRGRAPGPGLQGAPPPHLRSGPRSRRSRGGSGTKAAAPRRARPQRSEGLSLRLQRLAPLARDPVPRPFPLAPLAPGLCLLPCLDKDIKCNVTRYCGATARPALVTPQPPLPGEEGPLPSAHQTWARAAGARQTVSPASARKAGARAWPPFPRSHRASPWGPAPGPAAHAVRSPARGLLLGCPDFTDSGASERLAARLFPGASHASLSAQKGLRLGSSVRPARSPQQGLVQAVRLPGLTPAAPPLHPAAPTAGHSGLTGAPCPRALPAPTRRRPDAARAGPGPTEPVCAPGLAALSSAPRRPRPRAPRPRPEAPPHAPGRPRPLDRDWGPRAPTPSAAPVARATALRCRGARTAALGSQTPPGSMRGPGSLSSGVTPQPEGDSPAGALRFRGSPQPGRRQGDSDRRQQAALPRSWPRGGPGWTTPICRWPHGTSFGDTMPPPRDPGSWVPLPSLVLI